MAGCGGSYFGDCDGETVGGKDLLIAAKFSKINLFSETVGDVQTAAVDMNFLKRNNLLI
jgi:hypothetical protein